MRTLLIRNSRSSWREWLRENRGDRDILCLDPAETLFGAPARLCYVPEEKTTSWRFYGSLDPQRYPHVLMAAAATLSSKLTPNGIILAPVFDATPLQRHLFSLIAQVLNPSQILVAEGAAISMEGWPVGPETVALPEEFPPVVRHAQRKAQWLEMIEKSSEHQLLLNSIAIEGARLGSGMPVDRRVLAKAGFLAEDPKTQATRHNTLASPPTEDTTHKTSAPPSTLPGIGDDVYAEVCGGALLLVTASPVEENQLSRLLDITHTSKANVVEPGAYENLLCSVVDDTGDDIGIGIVRSVDLPGGKIDILSTAVPPAPIRVLRLGSLQVDSAGRELGETRPWQV